MNHHRAMQFNGRFKHLRRAIPLALIDSCILVIAYIVVYMVRHAEAALTLGTQGRVFMVLAVSVTFFLLYIFGGYNRIWARTSGHDVSVIVGAMAQATVLLALIDWLWRPRPVPLSVVLVGNLVATMGFVAVRYRSRLISGLSWRWQAVWHYQFPKPEMRVLVVGAGDAGQTTAWRLKHRAPRGKFAVVGFVDDDPHKQGMYIEGCEVLGTREDIPQLVDNWSRTTASI